MEVRVGGGYLLSMRSQEGHDFWSTATCVEVSRPEFLGSTDSSADESGNMVPASHHGVSAGFPLELRVTVAFEESGSATKPVLNHEGFPTSEDAELARTGWSENCDNPERVLTKQTKVASAV